ncbi:MAG: hypothetical protein CEN91_481 [Candidatus Berkelbacteria bacterium Licking1014_85]|uniref:Uncharacterized protein n=1 Tax=Candidatus Berkelbacteria bacterium Licking1014_85 TaxID=2017148 RepID=A0A554LHN8_9BACT|nr:MAG: hypothetical protein CEN91_481 [Candidatus Berkelbacteria bacterium Licking1014_85]
MEGGIDEGSLLQEHQKEEKEQTQENIKSIINSVDALLEKASNLFGSYKKFAKRYGFTRYSDTDFIGRELGSMILAKESKKYTSTGTEGRDLEIVSLQFPNNTDHSIWQTMPIRIILRKDEAVKPEYALEAKSYLVLTEETEVALKKNGKSEFDLREGHFGIPRLYEPNELSLEESSDILSVLNKITQFLDNLDREIIDKNGLSWVWKQIEEIVKQ